MNVYNLSRSFWDFAFDNPQHIKPMHIAVYFFAVDHCNRLGWKKNFGLPTSMAMDAIGIKSYSVYKRTFDDLARLGFFDVIQLSKNQYTANVIALKENNKANINALKENDKADYKATPKNDDCFDTCFETKVESNLQSTLQSNLQSTVSINKLINYNKTIESEQTEDKFVREGLDAGEDQLFWDLVDTFGFREARFDHHKRTIFAFVKKLKNENQIDNFIFQLKNYFAYKNLSGEQTHGFRSLIGTRENRFDDGCWNNENWEDKIAKYKPKKNTPPKPGVDQILTTMNQVDNPYPQQND